MTPPRTVQHTRKPGEVLDNSFITPGRFSELDGLRGIAALAVVAYHFGYPAVQNYPRIAPEPYSIPLGELGVQLFFIISGYVILLSAIKSGSALKFGISRFACTQPTGWRLRLPRLCIFSTVIPAGILRWRKPWLMRR